MSDEEKAVRIIEAIRCCHVCDDCKLNCEHCIYECSEEELQFALALAVKKLKGE